MDKLSHMERLLTLTPLVGNGQAFDNDVVFAAVWLHDLGVFYGHRPEDPVTLSQWDHTTYAMNQTPAILKRMSFPESKISAVVEAIRTHKPKDRPMTIEGQILHDADILEQLGAVTVLRTACKVGRDTRFETLQDVIKALQNQIELLPGLLQLDKAKRMSLPRIEILKRFLAAWQSETVTENP